MSDYTIKKKGTSKGEDQKIEVDLDPELKAKLFGAPIAPASFHVPKPQATFITTNHLLEMNSLLDSTRNKLRNMLNGVPVRFAKLAVKQLWLELRDVPDASYGDLADINVLDNSEETLG